MSALQEVRPDRERALRRAELIGDMLDDTAETFEAAVRELREAIAERDDIALGYRSPGDYVSQRFGGRLSRLGVDLRREVVRELTEAGLSTRAIAPVVGTSKNTVHRDLAVATVPGGTVSTPASTGIDGKTRPPSIQAQSAAAVAEFPDLAYHASLGKHRDVVAMAGDLRRFRERGELEERLGYLRRSIEVEKAKRAGEPIPPLDHPTPHNLTPVAQPAPAPAPATSPSPGPEPAPALVAGHPCPTCGQTVKETMR